MNILVIYFNKLSICVLYRQEIAHLELMETRYLQVFDREGDDGKFVSVTVKATDQGEPSLEGVCSFTVEITDVNDNPPLFDRQVRTLKHSGANVWRTQGGNKEREQMFRGNTKRDRPNYRPAACYCVICIDARHNSTLSCAL